MQEYPRGAPGMPQHDCRTSLRSQLSEGRHSCLFCLRLSLQRLGKCLVYDDVDIYRLNMFPREYHHLSPRVKREADKEDNVTFPSGDIFKNREKRGGPLGKAWRWLSTGMDRARNIGASSQAGTEDRATNTRHPPPPADVSDPQALTLHKY